MSNVFGKRIYQLRTEKGLTQASLAMSLGLNCNTIGKWENGLTAPGIDTLAAVAKRFNVSTDWLLGLSKKRRYDSAPETSDAAASQKKLEAARKAAEALRDNMMDLMTALRDPKVEAPAPKAEGDPRMYTKITAAANGDNKIFNYAYGEPWIQQALLMGDVCFDTPEAAKAAWEEGLI